MGPVQRSRGLLLVVVWAGDGGPGKLDRQPSLSIGPTAGKLLMTHRSRSTFTLLYGLRALYTNLATQTTARLYTRRKQRTR